MSCRLWNRLARLAEPIIVRVSRSNGIILLLYLPESLTASKHRRERQTTLLRQRLQDIRQQLHCELPVYIVLIELDRLLRIRASVPAAR